MNNDVSEIKRILEETVQESVQVNWDMLQQAANIFLTEQTSLEISKIQLQKRTQIASKSEIIGKQQFSSDIIKIAQDFKEFYRALFKFDQTLSNYLNEIPKRGLYVFFDQNGKPSTYEMSMEFLVNLANSQGKIGRLNVNNLQSIESQIDKKATEDLEHINKGACAAMGVNNRLENFYKNRGKQTIINKKTNKEKLVIAQRQGGLLMWKTSGTWKIAKIANAGVVAEAYASFLMTRHKSRRDYLVGIETGNPPYYSHSLIDKFYKYLSNVTNQSAIVEEDIYTEWAQYAVKGQHARLPDPQQYIRTAYTILSSSSEIAPKKLKRMVSDEFNKDSQLAPFIGEFLDEEVEKGIKDIMYAKRFYDSTNFSKFLSL